MIYNSPTNFQNTDGSLNIDSISEYVIEKYESDPARQQIRLPIDSTSLAVIRKSLGLVNNLTPQGGTILGTNALVNGIVSGYIKSANYSVGTAGWIINYDGSAEFNNITARGYISASTGFIGGWTINSSSISAVGVTLSSSGNASISFGTTPPTAPNIGTGIYMDKTGLFGLNANTQNFKLDATNGNITANTGTVGGCTLSTTSIGSTTFVSGALGSGWNISNTGTAEFQNVSVRGIIRTSVFEKDTISCVNGIVLVSKADVLTSDMTALDASTLTIKGDTTFVVNEVIRIKDGVDDEWMLVTNVASAPTYTVTRDLASSYPVNTNPIWKKGTAVVSMGVGTGTKTGFVLLDSSSANSPYIDIYGRNSNTYSDYTLHGRFGWLQGITDADVGLATTDVWGLYTDNAYIKGVIVAKTGYIGGTTGWTISTGSISSINGGNTTAMSSGGTNAYIAGTTGSPQFYVTHTGALTATSASITGTINATSGKFGTATNYWSVGSTGLTATSASTDVIINYGKTDFAQDTTAGFILGYDFSATKAKFEIGTTATGLLKYDGSLSVVGGSITSGLFSTAASGVTTQRVVLDSADNSLKFYNANNVSTVNISNGSGYGILITTDTSTSNGIYMSNTADQTTRGLYIEQTNNGSNNTLPCAEFHHDGHSTTGAVYIQSTHVSKGLYLDQSGTGQALYLVNSGSGQSIDINHSGNDNGINLSYSGTGIPILISNTSSGNISIEIDDASATNTMYMKKTGLGSILYLETRVNSATAITGITFDLDNSGTGVEYAFSFSGFEKITGAGGAVGGFQDAKVRVNVGGTPYYIPLYTA